MNPEGDRPVVAADMRERFSIILPGSWASVPMADADTMRAAATRIVKARMPRDDRLAAFRRDVREELLANATNAANAGADLYALSLEILPGLPFAASIVGFHHAWPPSLAAAAAAASDEELTALLLEVTPGATQMAEGSAPHVRRNSVRTSKLGETEMQMLDLEYWFADPSGALVCLMIAVPDCPTPELVTVLFDAVAASLFWTTRPTAPQSEAGAEPRTEREFGA